MKIGLLQGNGSDLVGGGSIQLEYNLWANSQADIELINFVYSDSNEYYYKKTYNGRTLFNVQEFNKKSSVDIFNNIDKLIILTYPFISDKPAEDYKLATWYSKMLKNRQKNNLWTGIICYDYKKEVVLGNIGAHYPDLYSFVDVIWVNNKNNPLIKYLNDIKSLAKIMVECPQFMNDDKLPWLSLENKAKQQLYYQGRSLDWKGWKEILPLKFNLQEENLFLNMTFNGITDAVESSYPFVQYTEFNQLAVDGFSDKLHDKNLIYGLYSPADANELTSKAAFGVYFTNLDPRENFLPEYTFIDFIRNGTVLIVPEWYFNGKLHPLNVDYNLIDKTPEEVGMLTWLPNNKDSTRKLKIMINHLLSDETLYNQYREKAFNYMMTTHGANHVIRKFLSY